MRDRERREASTTTGDYTEKGRRVAADTGIADNRIPSLGNFIQWA
jgi:hypothetical protein